MKRSTFLKSFVWHPVTGMVLAGLLGWMAAWLMLASGPLLSDGAVSNTDSIPAHQKLTSTQPLPGSDPAGPLQVSPAKPTFEQLLQRQEKISEGASRSTAMPPLAGSADASAPTMPTGKQALPDVRETARAEQMKAMRELQASALAEIQAVPPGDSKKMMAAIERFDAQMRAAGAPSIIDLDNIRKMLESSDRLQQLSRLLVTEAEKGRNADAVKVKAWTQEIQTVQQAMPRQYIKADVLKKQLGQ